MIIAVMSDTHDNIWNLEKALSAAGSADVLIHCGDLCSPFVIKRIGEWAKDRPVYIVWGNNDGDKQTLSSTAADYKNMELCGEYARLDLDETKIFVTHYPGIAEPVADSGDYDLVCYGHDHTRAERKVGGSILLNPGEVMGLNGTCSLALFDTGKQKCRFVEI